MRYQFLFAVVFFAGCHGYEIKSPESFDAEPVALSGKLGSLKIGDYQLADVERSWTKGSGMEIMSVKSEKRRQTYRYQVAGSSTRVSTACEFATNERTVGLRGGWQIMAGEGARLECDIKRSGEEAGFAPDLVISTASDDVLSGEYKGSRAYRVQGVGAAALTGGKKGQALGFHFFDGDRPVALVQIISPRRVLFARNLDGEQRAELVPAIAALLLLDESLRDF